MKTHNDSYYLAASIAHVVSTPRNRFPAVVLIPPKAVNKVKLGCELGTRWKNASQNCTCGHIKTAKNKILRYKVTHKYFGSNMSQ